MELDKSNLTNTSKQDKSISSVPKCFELLVNEYGVEIFKNGQKLYALCTDYIPNLDEDLKLLKVVCQSNVYKLFINAQESDIDVIKKKALKQLTEDAYLAEYHAKTAITWICKALYTKSSATQNDNGVSDSLDEEEDDENLVIKDGKLVRYNGKNSVLKLPENVTGFCEDDSQIQSNPYVLTLQYSNNFHSGYMREDFIKFFPNLEFVVVGTKLFDYYGLSTRVVIPNIVTEIAQSVFRSHKFNEVYIPDSVTTIGENAFQGCSCLTKIRTPDSVTTIGQSAFQECSCLTKIRIPDNVTQMGMYAFNGCKNLNEIYISKNLTTIEEGAFYGCSHLNILYIPDSVTQVDKFAFMGCESLSKIYIPRTLKILPISAVEECLNTTILYRD